MSFRWLIVALLAIPCSAGQNSRKSSVRHPLGAEHLDAVHQARIDFMKRRLVLPELGVYQDFRAVLHVPGAASEAVSAAKAGDVQIVLQSGPVTAAQTGLKSGILFLGGFPKPGQARKLLTNVPEPAPAHPKEAEYLRRAMDNPKEWKKLLGKMKDYPDEVFAEAAAAVPEFPARWDSGLGQSQKTPFDPYALSFRHAGVHILARELTEAAVRESLTAGRVYVAQEWLCDPSHMAFVAVNELGVFDIGDHVPLTRRTHLEAHVSIPANLKVIRDGQTVSETTGVEMRYPVTQPGAYRLEASINVDGEDRPWIATNPLYLLQPQSDLLATPPTALAANVQVFRNLPYDASKPEATLDLYVPKDKKAYPVLLFLPGNLWRDGNRAMYTAFGNRFAKDGLAVAIPDHQSASAPAQIEDAAAAFAWVRKFIAKYGGDPQRIYLGGHSQGGRIAALLALDPQYLEPHGLSPSDIKGVAVLSGLYNARDIAVLSPEDQPKRGTPPSLRIRTASPPFLVAYCQWDYPAVPYRTRQLQSALQKNFVATQLLYIPGENHLSEIVHVWRDDDPAAQAILQMVHSHP